MPVGGEIWRLYDSSKSTVISNQQKRNFSTIIVPGRVLIDLFEPDDARIGRAWRSGYLLCQYERQ